MFISLLRVVTFSQLLGLLAALSLSAMCSIASSQVAMDSSRWKNAKLFPPDGGAKPMVVLKADGTLDKLLRSPQEDASWTATNDGRVTLKYDGAVKDADNDIRMVITIELQLKDGETCSGTITSEVAGASLGRDVSTKTSTPIAYRVKFAAVGDPPPEMVPAVTVTGDRSTSPPASPEASARFNERVADEIRRLVAAYPGASAYQLAKHLDEVRNSTGDRDPAIVAAQHYFFGQQFSGVFDYLSDTVGYPVAWVGCHGWELIEASPLGMVLGAGPRYDSNGSYYGDIAQWGVNGMMNVPVPR